MEPHASIVLDADLASIERARAWYAPLLDAWRIGPRTRYAVELISEEVLANVAMHATPQATSVHLRCEAADAAVALEFTYAGPVFDPTTLATEARAAASTETTGEGGRGWRLVRAFARAVHYARRDGFNVVSITIDRTDDQAPSQL